MLCLMTVAAAFIGLRRPGSLPPTAIRVDSAASLVPVTAQVPPPLTPAPTPAPAPVATISLHELALQLAIRNSTSTTRPPTTTTTAKPTTTITTATTAPSAPATTAHTHPPTTTTPLTPLTTLVEAIVPPSTAVAPAAAARTDSGIASWFNAPDATCAHRTLPMGTIIKVTRVYTGAVASCKVNDRGPTLETGRLIDLSLDTFEKLAPRGIGLVDVTIEW